MKSSIACIVGVISLYFHSYVISRVIDDTDPNWWSIPTVILLFASLTASFVYVIRRID